jgi:hypothetical protein
MNTPKSQTKNNGKKRGFVFIAYFLAGAAIYLIARFLVFYNTDEGNLLTGSQYCLDHEAPWSIAWPLADCLLSKLIPLLGNSFHSITITGALLSGFGSAITGITAERLSGRYSLATWSALLTGLWLVSPAGGWITDSLSYSIGLAPSYWAVNRRYSHQKWSIAAVAGCCLSIGLVLKWNSFIPAYACSLAYISINDYFKLRSKQDLSSILTIFIGSAVITGLTCSALLHSPSIYGETINFYYNLRNAPVEKGFAPATIWGRLSFPFNIDFYSALRENRPGDLYFLPAWITYWISVISGIALLRRNRSSDSLRFGLFLLISTGLTGCTLGRGMNHRLLLMPVGLLLIAHNLNNPAVRKQCIAAINIFFTGGWLILSLQQSLSASGLDARGHWLGSLKSYANRKLCIENSILVVTQSGNTGLKNPGNQCFERRYIINNFSAMGLMSIPNELGISIKEASSRTAPLREQWNGNTASHSGRIQLADNIVDQIRSNRSSYLLESYSSAITSGELSTSWAEGRREIFTVIKQKLKLQYVGDQSGQTLWKVGNDPRSALNQQS